jgi:hypothetical protein
MTPCRRAVRCLPASCGTASIPVVVFDYWSTSFCVGSPSIASIPVVVSDAILGHATVTPSVSALTSSLFTAVALAIHTGVIVEFEGFAFGRFLTFEEVGNLLTALEKDFDQSFRDRLVFIIVERGR